MTIGGLIAVVLLFVLLTWAFAAFIRGTWPWWRAVSYVFLWYAVLLAAAAAIFAFGLFLTSLDQPV